MPPITILVQLLCHQYGYPGEQSLLGAVSSLSGTGDDGRGVAEEEEEELPPGGLLRHHYLAQHWSPRSLLQVINGHTILTLTFFVINF